MSYKNRYVIYVLIDPRTSQVRYVGKSFSGLRRPQRHWRRCELVKDLTYKGNWIRELVAEGLVPTVEIVEEFPTAEPLDAAEVRWINHHRAAGAPLTNLAEGGRSGGHPHTEESKRRIGAGNKGKCKGRTLTEDHKNKIAQAAVGRTLPEEWRQAISAGNKGKPKSEVHRAALATSLGGRKIQDDLGNIYASYSEAGRVLGVTAAAVSASARKGFSCKGRRFTFVDPL